ncbi:hypothetical protein U5801_12325 [Lamprobacter modestohalophilus]|uniref:hypothetical protein n=1 Tax=Lamprobacter modestohalophilus TaxID=1064514 RepID=UPI002ADEC1E3|nr:hypothetical protein [Lamprobacter modestohalophilus]MEA1050587.1 hypothetical protein [Lamprobacter modestohalophilus]
MSPRIEVLAEAAQALGLAAERLRTTHTGVSQWFPLTPLSIEQLPEASRERLDAYAIRYARCQDLLFPAMRALGRAQLEPKADGSFLDLFALMQKQGIVNEPQAWERQRELRNVVGHEYPDSRTIADILNGIHAETPDILACVGRWLAQADALMNG